MPASVVQLRGEARVDEDLAAQSSINSSPEETLASYIAIEQVPEVLTDLPPASPPIPLEVEAARAAVEEVADAQIQERSEVATGSAGTPHSAT